MSASSSAPASNELITIKIKHSTAGNTFNVQCKPVCFVCWSHIDSFFVVVVVIVDDDDNNNDRSLNLLYFYPSPFVLDQQSDLVETLRSHVFKETEIPPKDQRLIYKGHILKDGRTLARYKDNDEIHTFC